MCCTDLMPFSIVEKDGFKKFLLQNNVIKSAADMPSADILTRGCLQTVYDETLRHVKQIIQKAPKTVGMTTDMWTDNYVRRSYITFTLHFCTSDFTLHDLVLRTVVFPEAHNAENIKKAINETFEMFDLKEKIVIFTTDQGSNIVKACKLAKIERFGCVAHGLHNLITVDGIGKCEVVKNIVDKVKDIIKVFTFKTSMYEKEAADMNQENMTAELELLAEQVNNEEEICFDPLDDEQSDDISDTRTTASSNKPVFTALKRDCPTRWNSLLTMLNSLLKNQVLVERCLTKLRLFEKILTDDEWQTVNNVARFLEAFKCATEVLSGSAYSTVCMALLFRSEIVSALSPNDDDCEIVRGIKQRMRSALNHRFPLLELYVVAAMLDPSQRHLAAVQDYLLENDVTAVQLLRKFIIKYVETDSVNASAQMLTVALANDPTEVPYKRAKRDLINKHAQSASYVDQELQQYRCLSVSTDDCLKWWSMQTRTYVQLSQLARAVFAIPATSAPSERVFSTAGITLSARRSRLLPSNVDKIIFVHDNVKLVNPNGD